MARQLQRAFPRARTHPPGRFLSLPLRLGRNKIPFHHQHPLRDRRPASGQRHVAREHKTKLGKGKPLPLSGEVQLDLYCKRAQGQFVAPTAFYYDRQPGPQQHDGARFLIRLLGISAGEITGDAASGVTAAMADELLRDGDEALLRQVWQQLSAA